MAPIPLRPRKTIWTKDDNERLKAMVLKGVSLLRAAAAFNCTRDAVRVQARKLGTPFPIIGQAKKRLAAKMTPPSHEHPER
jgi:hypothetical protein